MKKSPYSPFMNIAKKINFSISSNDMIYNRPNRNIAAFSRTRFRFSILHWYFCGFFAIYA